VDVIDERAREGARSLRLSLGESPEAAARQSLPAGVIPEYVSGFFFVDGWGPDGGQHIELVARIRGGDFGDGFDVHELRLLLGGSVAAPLSLPAVRHIFIDRDAPAEGEWVYFGYPLSHGFESVFGHTPAGWDALEIVLVVRRDGEAASATVHFDEIYGGPQRFNPNHPDDG
jgi:hypothetical protein